MMRFVIGLPLAMHGLAHLGGFLASWVANRAGFSDRPWTFSQKVTLQSPLGRTLSLLWLLAAIGLAGGGVGAILQRIWWPILTLAGAGVSVVAILSWWRAVPAGAKLGAALDFLILIASLSPWSERIVALVG